jgi:hypothetical protein
LHRENALSYHTHFTQVLGDELITFTFEQKLRIKFK